MGNADSVIKNLSAGSVVKTLPAVQETQDPWSGKIPHVPEQLSLCATNNEAVF